MLCLPPAFLLLLLPIFSSAFPIRNDAPQVVMTFSPLKKSSTPDFARLARLTSTYQCSSQEPTVLFYNSSSRSESSSVTIVQPSVYSGSSLVAFLDLIGHREGKTTFNTPETLRSEFFPNVSEHAAIMSGVKTAFEADAAKVRADVEDYVSEKQDQGEKVAMIELTGHGLGADIALLHALHLASSPSLPSDLPISVYLFNPFRPGNSHFVSFVKSFPSRVHIHMITSKTDIVPHLPPRFQGFRDIPSRRHWEISPITGEIRTKRWVVWDDMWMGGREMRGSEVEEPLTMGAHLGAVEGSVFDDSVCQTYH